MQFRIGQGLDIHAFTDGDHVMLCGVRLPHDRGLAAHSDGDVAIHALCDAMLGASAQGDIGQHFPPGDDQWRDADSTVLLAKVRELLAEQGWQLVNLDLTIVCESPRIAPHVNLMRETLAEVLGTPASVVSVKATSTEKLGLCGRGEGIAVLALVLIQGEG
ncbi:MAG: 2-C-methyl-D-erythritol 2,4-cyclodiphosphate synthase [Lysobacterales bacterium]